MTWAELLAAPSEITLPWLGGRRIYDRDRTYLVSGDAPAEHGWHRFGVGGSRRARWLGAGERDFDFANGRPTRAGYLVEDRLVPDGVHVSPDPTELFTRGLPVWLVDRGLPRFSRARVARRADGKLVYVGPEFPLGPEADVRHAFADGALSLHGVSGVTPALHLAFLWHVARRRMAEERRRRIAEEAARAERARAFREAIGTAVGRRRLAAQDFEAAARAALAVGGAELLDARAAPAANERVVTLGFRGRRFECVVDARTLRVVDAGICLIDHATGETGDTRFTLESLVAVLAEAIDTHRLVVFRHVG